MGFSGYTSAALQSPPLSTVDFGYARIGRIAVDMLRQSEQWFGKSIPVVYSPYDVIPRRSTDFFPVGLRGKRQKERKENKSFTSQFVL